jgi:hypothetical protein
MPFLKEVFAMLAKILGNKSFCLLCAPCRVALPIKDDIEAARRRRRKRI